MKPSWASTWRSPGDLHRHQAEEGPRAPASINLEELLAEASRPAKWLKEQTDQELTGQAADAVKKAATIEDLLAALEKRSPTR